MCPTPMATAPEPALDYVPFPKQTLERVGPASWRIQDKPNGGSCGWLRL